MSLFGFGSASAGLPARIIALDLCERIIIATVYGSFAWRMLQNYSGNADVSTLLIVISEALLRAPSATLSRGRRTGRSRSPQRLPFWSCSLMQVPAGRLMRADRRQAVLGRCFAAANRGVRQLGPYRFVRHPMYAGYTLAHIGFLLAMPSVFNVAAYALGLIQQLVRIAREERVPDARPDLYRVRRARAYRLLPFVY